MEPTQTTDDIKSLIRSTVSDYFMAPRQNVDGWTNVMTGLGGKKDKSSYTAYGNYNILDDETLSSIYMSDGLGGRIIDVVADDMTREWIKFDDEEEEKSPGDFVADEFMRLNAESKFNEAIKWQRLYGGSLIIVGAMDGQKPDKPLKPNKVKSIEYLKVVDRTQISISECIFDTNPNNPTFGQVLVYKINYRVGSEIIPAYVHYTRVIPFYNDAVPSLIRNALDTSHRYWGMSSLQRIYEELRDLGGILQSTVNIMYEFIIGKYKFEHLNDMLASGQEQLLITRLEIIQTAKSVLNAVVLGENEEYTRDYATLAGLPEVIDRFMLKLSGSTGIPVTRLFGRSPAGLNATGENDLRNYYDVVESSQRNRLLAPLRMLTALIAEVNHLSYIPDFTFNSLYQMSEPEIADMEKTKAETAKIYSDIESSQIANGIRDNIDIAKEHGFSVPEIDDMEEEKDTEDDEEETNGSIS